MNYEICNIDFFFLAHTELCSLLECVYSHTQAIKLYVSIYPGFNKEVTEKTEGEVVSVAEL